MWIYKKGLLKLLKEKVEVELDNTSRWIIAV